MAVTWKINNVNYIKSLSGKTNVVNEVDWSCSDSDSDGNTGQSYGSVSIPTDDLSSFTAYDSLTESTVLGWVKDALGSTAVTSIENRIASEIAEKATPTKGSGIPW